MSQLQHSSTRQDRMAPQDWARVQRLYSFCRARAIERIIAAKDGSISQRRDLATLEAMYSQAWQQNDIVIACAVTYFRTQAFRDAQHPDFLGEWIGAS